MKAFKYLYYRLCIYYKEMDDSRFKWNTFYMFALYSTMVCGILFFLMDIVLQLLISLDFRNYPVSWKTIFLIVNVIILFFLYVIIFKRPFEYYVDLFNDCKKYNRINIEWLRAFPIILGLVLISIFILLDMHLFDK